MLFELLKDHETGMSKFQDDYFVTMRAGGTLYGQYKQSLRELYKRYRGLRESVFSRKRLDVDIEEAKYNSKNASGKFDRQRAVIDLSEKLVQIEESERVIENTKREFTNFYNQAVFYKKKLGKLTEERKAQLEREMWVFKLKDMAAVDLISQGRITIGTLDLLRSFPTKMRNQVSIEIKNHDKLINWYENSTTEFLPKEFPSAIDIKEIMEVIEC